MEKSQINKINQKGVTLILVLKLTREKEKKKKKKKTNLVRLSWEAGNTN